MNLIRQAGSCETVRNHDHGAPACETAETTKPISFRPRIHRAGRLVENQYGGPPQKSSRQGDALPFPDAQFGALCEPAPEQLIVAGGKLVDNLVGARISRSFGHSIGPCDLEVSQRDVLSRRGVVVDRLLKQDGDRAADLLESEMSQNCSVKFNSAGIRIVEATQQIQQGALPRAIRSDNCSDRARRDCEIESAESRAFCSGI